MQLQKIQSKIYEIKSQKVMIDFDLAEMYDVENRALKQAVKRNIDRFPKDFMFMVTKAEWKDLITKCDKLPENEAINYLINEKKKEVDFNDRERVGFKK